MLQEMPWNICWNVHGLTWHVTFKPFSSYSIHCTCTYAQRSWQRIIISRADLERCKGFRIPMKNSYLLNSLSKIIENNKPQPVPLFRFLGNILYTRICLIFFLQIWTCLTFFRCLRFDVTMKTSYPWITEQNLKALVWRREWVVCWVVGGG